jgi:membrane protein
MDLISIEKAFFRNLVLLKDSFIESRKDNVPQLAAAFSYYAIFLVLPLLLIFISAGGLIFRNNIVSEAVLNYLSHNIGPEAVLFVQYILEARVINLEAYIMIAGFFLVLFGATNLFTFLSESLDDIYEIRDKVQVSIAKFIRKRVASFIYLIAFSLILMILIAAYAVAAFFGESAFFLFNIPLSVFWWPVVQIVLYFSSLVLIFFLFFRHFSSRNLKPSDVLPGAVVSAILFIIVNFFAGLFFSVNRNIGLFYGTATTLIVALIWMFYSAQATFIGAEFIKLRMKDQNRWDK